MAEEQKFLQLPALGLPFALGTFYDSNKSKIIPAISLCEYKDAEERNANVESRRNVTCRTDITTGDSLESRMDSAGIRGNLRISVLANKLDVQGYGKYVNSKKTSKTQATIRLETSGTTKDEFLLMNCFSRENVERHQELIEKIGATHVVVGITYGYEFSLVLETKCDSEEKKLEAEGSIKLKVSAWIVQGEVSGSGSHEEQEDRIENKLTVRIHGNVQIPSNPTSFKDAMEIYKRIPELVKDKDCPMIVYLLPLASLCTFAPKVCNEITEATLSSVTAIFEDISNSEVALSEIQASDIATKEPRIRRKAQQLATVLKGHKIWLQTKLHDILSNPKTEKSSSETEQIQKLLRRHENSPFANKILGIYVSKLEKEVHFMENLVKMFKFSQEDGSSGFDTNREDGKDARNKITIDILSDETDFLVPFDRSKVFVLEIPIIKEDDDLLEEMQTYVADTDETSARHKVESLTLPFEDKIFQTKILKCVKIFVHLADSNKSNYDKTLAKFRCVFKVYKDNEKPTINEYNAFIGESEQFDTEHYIRKMMKP